MNLLRRLGAAVGILAASTVALAQTTPAKNDHAVVVHFAYGSTDLKKLFALEDELEKAILAAKVGEFDGNEVAVDGSNGYLYMYGTNADSLFEVIKPILEKSPFVRGAKAKLRYGPAQVGAHEKVIVINP